ncbi:hypothetical protein Tco_0767522 [Tanacetum coccineum]
MVAMDAAMKAQYKGKGSIHNEFQGSSKPLWVEETNFDGDAPWWVKKPNRRSHTKMNFPCFDELKVDVAAMYLDGDALDLFSRINNDRTLLYWEDLVNVLQEHYGPTKFQNPDEKKHLHKPTLTLMEHEDVDQVEEEVEEDKRCRNLFSCHLREVFLCYYEAS